MNPPAFRRVAILEPNLVFSDPLRKKFNQQAITEVRKWLNLIKKNGADAVYARVYHESNHFIGGLLNMLFETSGMEQYDLFTIFPASEFYPLHHHHADAYHLRASEKNNLKGNHFIVRSRSCHSLTQAIAAQDEGMDYVFLSPVFSTKTHPEAEPLGLEKLHEVCAQVDIPVIALGGITEEREKACLEAGAHGIAAIRMFLNEGDIA